MKATKDMMVKEGQFDYTMVDETTRNELKEYEERIEGRTGKVEHILSIEAWQFGKDYAYVQKLLSVFGHGTFTQWLKSKSKYSRATVYRFISIYKKFNYSTIEQTSLPLKVLEELAKSSTPEDAIVKVFEKERNGERVTSTSVKKICKDASAGVNNTEEMDKHIWEDTSKGVNTEMSKDTSKEVSKKVNKCFDYSEIEDDSTSLKFAKESEHILANTPLNIDTIWKIGHQFMEARSAFMFNYEELYPNWIISCTDYTIPFANWADKVFLKFRFNQHEMEGMSFEDLAEAIGIPMPTIYQDDTSEKEEEQEEDVSVLFSIDDSEDSEDTSFEYDMNEFDVSDIASVEEDIKDTSLEYDMNEFDVSDTASVKEDIEDTNTNTTSFAYDGNNTEVLERIILNHFDAIPSFKLMIMDAPYNTHSNKDIKSSDVYNALGVLSDVLHHAYAKAQENSTVMCFADRRYTYLFRQVIEDAGFTYHDTHIWLKNNSSSYDCVIHAVKGNPDNTYQYNSVLTGKVFLSSTHPNKKPVDMLENIITSTTDVGDVVVDAFGGSGDTFVASGETDRVGYAFEVDENCYNSVLSTVLNEQENIKY